MPRSMFSLFTVLNILLFLLAIGCDSAERQGWSGCEIDGVQYGDGQVDPNNVCRICDVDVSEDDWSDNDGAVCDDGIFCNGADSCLGGACSEHAGDPCPDDGLYCNGSEICSDDMAACDHSGDPCAFPHFCLELADSCLLSCTGCAIGDVCYFSGQSNPDNVCQFCHPEASSDSWSDNDLAACDDGEYCNGEDTCLSGECSEHSGNPCSDDGVFCNGPEVCHEDSDQCNHGGDPCTPPEVCYEDSGSCMTKEEHSTELWTTSGHADASSPAFNEWNDATPAEVPGACARCHTTTGFIDFLPDGMVSGSVPLGEVLDCTACHLDQSAGIARDLPTVTFPSGETAENLGPMSLCAACHQGRASTPAVDGMIAAAGVGEDISSSQLRFVNSHYTAAAATQFGTMAQGGYQYPGRSYDARFSHTDGNNDCMFCHDQHSLDVDLEHCNQCHPNVSDPRDIRTYGSFPDYDGDGDTTEGVFYEIQGVRERLYAAIRMYAGFIANAVIVYDEDTYPYFFNDTNANGEVDPEEADYANRYISFTPRLLRAAYNYQFSIKDPGCFAHGGKYTIQLLYDSIDSLAAMLGGWITTEGFHRIDEGHFNGAAAPFREWDADGEVSSICARCHTPRGFTYFLENGTNLPEEIPNGLFCSSCHTTPPDTHPVASVEFPSGDTIDLGDSSNQCAVCHQGRASKITVDGAIASAPGPYNFVNIHNGHQAAIFYGYETHGGYEYSGKVYTGRQPFANHMGRYDTCVECHKATNTLRPQRLPSDHNSKTPNREDCVYCHGQDVSQPNPGADPDFFFFTGIRPANIPDYDGDGNRSESIKTEIHGLQATLYARIQAYGFAIGRPVVFSQNVYPYFFDDNNGNGLVDPGEAIYANRYQFDAKLLKAGYNYYLTKRAPAGYIHNSLYVAQLMVDSIQDLGGNVAPYTWR